MTLIEADAHGISRGACAAPQSAACRLLPAAAVAVVCIPEVGPDLEVGRDDARFQAVEVVVGVGEDPGETIGKPRYVAVGSVLVVKVFKPNNAVRVRPGLRFQQSPAIIIVNMVEENFVPIVALGRGTKHKPFRKALSSGVETSKGDGLRSH